MMSGLPASGKTTTAMRLHACTGGVLIRSCDVYQALRISLPEWVKRTQGFTVNVAAYERVRDRAYREMARRLAESLASRGALVILDAVHGEPDKRQAVYEICQAHGVTPVLMVCRCDDLEEVGRRFRARRGREAQPEHEASDLSVFRDIRRRWCDPHADRLPDGRPVPMVTYDTQYGELTVTGHMVQPVLDLIRASLLPAARLTRSSARGTASVVFDAWQIMDP